jgi:hypothetical protein
MTEKQERASYIMQRLSEKTVEYARTQITQSKIRKITWPGIEYDTTLLGVDGDRIRHEEVREWLENTLGPEWQDSYVNGRWMKHYAVIFFKDDADLMLFKLKWM